MIETQVGRAAPVDQSVMILNQSLGIGRHEQKRLALLTRDRGGDDIAIGSLAILHQQLGAIQDEAISFRL